MSTSRQDAERTLTTALVRLARTYRRQVNQVIGEHGLSDARSLPVLHISRLGEGVRQGVLAEDMGLENPSLATLLDQLCAAGLVERRPDPSDGRAKTLHLTPAGRSLAATLEEATCRLRGSLLAEVSDADLSAALRVFAQFEERLQHRSARS